jgi:hypothetical protein
MTMSQKPSLSKTPQAVSKAVTGNTGSGTILIAAERTGRRGFGMEISPRYVDAALTRFSKLFSIDPVLLRTGEKFSELQRRSEKYAGGDRAGCDPAQEPTPAGEGDHGR